jgi:hypothetical protein
MATRDDRLARLEKHLASLEQSIRDFLVRPWPGIVVVHTSGSGELDLGKVLHLLGDPRDVGFGPKEAPAPPWKHLVMRRHPWRRQLYIKGRNMTVRQLVGTVQANRFTPEQAAEDLGLPVGEPPGRVRGVPG